MSQKVQRLGSDRVIEAGEGLVVSSTVDMPNWDVRDFRRTAIHFQGQKYFLTHKEKAAGRFRYRLVPWTEDFEDIAGHVVEYDEAFVKDRDEVLRAQASARRLSVFFPFFYPVIGLLPGWIKRWLADSYGVSEEVTTQQSLFLEYAVIILAIAFVSITTMAGGMVGAQSPPWIAQLLKGSWLVFFVVTPDAVVRHHKVLGESSYPWGFWEWLWRWRD